MWTLQIQNLYLINLHFKPNHYKNGLLLSYIKLRILLGERGIDPRFLLENVI